MNPNFEDETPEEREARIEKESEEILALNTGIVSWIFYESVTFVSFTFFWF